MLEMTNRLEQSNSLVALLKPSLENHIGYVYSMNYNNALILTNDAWKDRVGGIPHNSFLIAAAFDPDKFAGTADIDKEIILLRILRAASLPQDADLTKTRIEHHQRRSSPADADENYDPLTAAEMQYGGLECRILGTFFLEPESGYLRFGSDIENFMASSKLLVYKPAPDTLEKIVNHVNPEILEKTKNEMIRGGIKSFEPLEIGSVRYTSSNRMQRSSKASEVKVRIQPADFLARRTAVLGMTRTGKSNTVKTTIAAVANMAAKDAPIGQLVFDINGEYANANHQDEGSSIADVFKDRCERYRGLINDNDEGFRDLRINFYHRPGEALSLLRDLVTAEFGDNLSQDLKDLLNSSLEEPDRKEKGGHTRWEKRKAIFQCILYEAGFIAPANLMIHFIISQEVFAALGMGASFPKPQNSRLSLTIGQAKEMFLKIRTKNKEKELKSSTGGAWLDSTEQAYLNVLAGLSKSDTYIKGFRIFNSYTAYHSPNRDDTDILKEIINFLYEGKIVILDLSVGRPTIRKTLAERIAHQVFEKGMNDMHSGKTPNNIVLYIEEAHNLIGKDDPLDNTWPRIAKEGAKARIALVYATQEPSSIHKNILANTENWFVCHLNNDDEIKTLSKFYDLRTSQHP